MLWGYCLQKRSLISLSHIVSNKAVPKPDHIFDLERRFQAIEKEIADTLPFCSSDDPMIADLKRRLLHLRDELQQLHHDAVQDQKLH